MPKRIRYRSPSAAQIILLSQKGFAKDAPTDRASTQDFAAMLRVVMGSYVTKLNNSASDTTKSDE